MAIYAANNPNITKRIVATKLCMVFFATSLIDLSINLHPTEAPNINKQKLILSLGSL